MSENLVQYDGNVLTYVPPDLSQITIKATTVSIKGELNDNYAFYEARNDIVSVYFEDNPQLTSIPLYCFYLCSKLQTIELSKCKNLTSISAYSFQGCTSLQSIDLPSSLQTIGEKAFYQTGLINVIIPASVLRIDDNAFSTTQIKSFTFEN